jgi:hypothetical protein
VISSDKEDKPNQAALKISRLFFKRFENRMFLFGELLKDHSKSEIEEFSLKIDEITQGVPKPSKPPSDIPERFIPERVDPLVKTLKRGSPEYQELYKQFALDGIDVLVSVDGKRSLRDIQDLLGLTLERVREIVVFALNKKMLRGLLLRQESPPHQSDLYQVSNPLKTDEFLKDYPGENTIDPPSPRDVDARVFDGGSGVSSDPPVRPTASRPSMPPTGNGFPLTNDPFARILGDKVIQFCFVCGDPLNLESFDGDSISLSKEQIQCNHCGAIYHEKCVRENSRFSKKKYKCPQCRHKGKGSDANDF